MSQQIKYNNRIIGTLTSVADLLIFSKFVNPKKHLFRIYNAYGIQKDVFDKYLKGNLGKIVITEKGGGVLESKISKWEEYGIVSNFGNGEQVFLPLRYMKDLASGQKELF